MTVSRSTFALAPLIVRHGAFALATVYEAAAALRRKVGATADAELLGVIARELRSYGGRAIDGFPEADLPIALDGISTALRLAAGRHWGSGEVLGLRECGHVPPGEGWRFPAYLASGRFEGTGPDDVFALLAMIATTLWDCGAN